MFGSYNAGRPTCSEPRVSLATRLDARSWAGIVVVAPDVPRWRHVETLSYVDRISDNLALLDRRGRTQVASHPSPKTPGGGPQASH